MSLHRPFAPSHQPSCQRLASWTRVPPRVEKPGDGHGAGVGVDDHDHGLSFSRIGIVRISHDSPRLSPFVNSELVALFVRCQYLLRFRRAGNRPPCRQIFLPRPARDAVVRTLPARNPEHTFEFPALDHLPNRLARYIEPPRDVRRGQCAIHVLLDVHSASLCGYSRTFVIMVYEPPHPSSISFHHSSGRSMSATSRLLISTVPSSLTATPCAHSCAGDQSMYIDAGIPIRSSAHSPSTDAVEQSPTNPRRNTRSMLGTRMSYRAGRRSAP